MPKFADLTGILGTYLKIGVTTAIRLKNSSGALVVRNAGDSADVAVTASTLNASGTSITINSAITNKTTIGSAASPTVPVVFNLPPDNGTAGYGLQTDGSGNLTWVASGSTGNKLTTDTTNLVFGTTSPLTLFTLPANAVVENVRIIVDTAFNGTPSVSLGIAGTTSKYFASTQVDLATVGVFECYPGIIPVGTTEALIATYSAGGASAGAARIEIDYVIPS